MPPLALKEPVIALATFCWLMVRPLFSGGTPPLFGGGTKFNTRLRKALLASVLRLVWKPDGRLLLIGPLKLPLTPPAAVRMVYCLATRRNPRGRYAAKCFEPTKVPGAKIALTVAPPSVALPVT